MALPYPRPQAGAAFLKGYSVGDVLPLTGQHGDEDTEGNQDHDREHGPSHHLEGMEALRPAVHSGPVRWQCPLRLDDYSVWDDPSVAPAAVVHLQDGGREHSRPWAFCRSPAWLGDPRDRNPPPSIAQSLLLMAELAERDQSGGPPWGTKGSPVEPTQATVTMQLWKMEGAPTQKDPGVCRGQSAASARTV